MAVYIELLVRNFLLNAERLAAVKPGRLSPPCAQPSRMTSAIYLEADCRAC